MTMAKYVLVGRSPNYAFERPGLRFSRARVRHAFHIAPATRLKRLRPAAQRES